jgi:hypothetical protein
VTGAGPGGPAPGVVERRARLLAGALLAVGLSAVAFDLVGWEGAARWAGLTAAAPAPGGPLRERGRFDLPTTRLFLVWRDGAGAARHRELAQAELSRLRGPARRRAVYRLALAKGPELAADPLRRPLLDALLQQGLCGDRPLWRELDLGPEVPDSALALQYQPVRPGSAEPLLWPVPCP